MKRKLAASGLLAIFLAAGACRTDPKPVAEPVRKAPKKPAVAKLVDPDIPEATESIDDVAIPLLEDAPPPPAACANVDQDAIDASFDKVTQALMAVHHGLWLATPKAPMDDAVAAKAASQYLAYRRGVADAGTKLKERERLGTLVKRLPQGASEKTAKKDAAIIPRLFGAGFDGAPAFDDDLEVPDRDALQLPPEHLMAEHPTPTQESALSVIDVARWLAAVNSEIVAEIAITCAQAQIDPVPKKSVDEYGD